VGLDPDFDLSTALQPYATKLIAERYSPASLARRASSTGMEALELGAEAPRAIRALFDIIESGGIQVRLRAEELEPLVSRLERIGNRLVAGTIAAALITEVGRLTAGGAPKRRWERTMFGLRIGQIGALTGYLAVTARHWRPRE
jgi:ubiquinone biosynthesis protein